MICDHYLIVLSELKGDRQAKQLWLKKQKPLTCVPLAPEKGKQTQHCHTEQCPQHSLLLTALSVLCVCAREREGPCICACNWLSGMDGRKCERVRAWGSSMTNFPQENSETCPVLMGHLEQFWWIEVDWATGVCGLFFFFFNLALKEILSNLVFNLKMFDLSCLLSAQLLPVDYISCWFRVYIHKNISHLTHCVQDQDKAGTDN